MHKELKFTACLFSVLLLWLNEVFAFNDMTPPTSLIALVLIAGLVIVGGICWLVIYLSNRGLTVKKVNEKENSQNK